MQTLEKLKNISEFCSERQTTGLSFSALSEFIEKDPDLVRAIDEAWVKHQQLRQSYPEFLQLPEHIQISQAQSGYVNFYEPWSVNPYMALAARGPWIISMKGAVIHDSGGYGMLGFGHGPEQILEAMNQNHVMANIMTANLAQKTFSDAIKKEIGHSRPSGERQPYHRIICMNSGSEAVSVASRLSDIHASFQMKSFARGKQIRFMSLKGSFHGRTDRPSQFSDSSLPKYRQHLKSFQERNNLLTITPNDCQELSDTFKRCQHENIWIEAMLIEPVMGEGDPGKAVTPEFYQLARELTKKHHSLLIVDSIQAGLRAHGCLSMMDYPGFQDLEAPDMETFSKALNAGQYPLSVLAMNQRTAELYVTGVYGNTMTTNPRALSVACAVLDMVTPQLRQNIQERGREFLRIFSDIKAEFPSLITKIQGTGLLFSMELASDRVSVNGHDGLEMRLRKKGLGVIHGGTNSLRFTPHFRITSQEAHLIADILREELRSF